MPDLAIIDFSIGVEGDGPTVGGENGRTVDLKKRLGSWLLLASTDLVAACQAQASRAPIGAGRTARRCAPAVGLAAAIADW